MLAKAVKRISPRSFEVEVNETRKRFRRNIDHLTSAVSDIKMPDSSIDNVDNSQKPNFDELDFELSDEPKANENSETTQAADEIITNTDVQQGAQGPTFIEQRRSTRTKKTVARLDL